MSSRGVDVDQLGCSAVFAGEPVVGEVEVDAGRLDRAVPGLGLHRLQRHACLAQPGQAGVAQLMTGAPLEPGPSTGAGDDLIEPFEAAAVGRVAALQHDEDPVGVDPERAFVAQVVADRGEERVGDRHQPLMAALAVGDEHGSIGRPGCRPGAGRAPRSGAARRAASPTPSPGPVLCAAHRARRRPRPATGSSATSAGPGPAAPCELGHRRAGSAGRVAPGSPSPACRRERRGRRRSPTPTTGGERSCVPTAPTPDQPGGPPCGHRAAGPGTRTRAPPHRHRRPRRRPLKNTFRSNATARTVFGRHRPATNCEIAVHERLTQRVARLTRRRHRPDQTRERVHPRHAPSPLRTRRGCPQDHPCIRR